VCAAGENQLGDLLLKSKDSIAKQPTKITLRHLSLVSKIAATSIIWLVFAIGIWESDGNTSEMVTVVAATLAMVISTFYVWRVDQIGNWLSREKSD
jgi:hypothetical protein